MRVSTRGLDPSNCQPLNVPVFPAAGGVTPSAFTAPSIGGIGPSFP
ncbi:MAG TPA: hypothetical protein VGQ32_06995 [Thermoanaerobaculia bacterium]|nr:hypothetical protein [Thermoanaerobaculia bacterium]